MKKLISCLTVCFLVSACTSQIHRPIIAGTQPADFSWRCQRDFPNGQPKEKVLVPQELDVRSCDVSTWDFSNYTATELADILTFDSKTKFPPKDKLPKGFSPAKILKQNQNPGLNIHKLHKQGITGKGVSVAIMDQNLLLDHEQYADRLQYYWQDPIYQQTKASMHGAAVTSILAGKTVGVAPQADVYYWAEHLKIDDNGILDAGEAGEDLIRVLDYNFSLPEEKRIRVVSISRGFNKRDKGSEKFNAVLKEFADNYIAVFTRGKEDLSYYADIQNPLVPTDFRVTAAPNGPQDYVHYANGGLSWAVPYLAGLYALGVQVYPALTKEIFMQAARDTANTQTCTYQGEKFTARYFVNPTALINRLKELNNAK